MDVPEEGGPRRQPSLRRSTKNIARDAAQAAGASSAAPSATAGENAETLGPSSKGKMPLSPNASSRHTTTSSNTVTTPTSPSLANSPRLGKTWAQRAASSSSATAGGGTGAQRRDSASTQRKVSMMAPPRSNSKVRLSAATTSNHSDDASDTGSAPGETRPPALSRNSTRDNLLALQQSNPSGDPDDEISRHDRGEELIRRRMKERKAEKKARF